MRSRPHIVTQTRLYPVARLARSADRLSRRMGEVKQLRELLGYSRVLIRLMKIILDLTLHNDCFLARQQALETPRTRQDVMDGLGGAPALLKWRRKNTWNKGRLAAIASGTYRPAPEMADAHTADRLASDSPKRPRAAKADTCSVPGLFRLPVLQNLHDVSRARPPETPGPRRAGQRRWPSIVLWPHELDGQYVQDFHSRARRPQDCYGPAETLTRPAPGRQPPSIFAPP